MEQIATLALLAYSSFKDIKTKTVSIYVTMLFSIVGIVLHMLFARASILDICGGLGVGVMVLFVSFLTKNAIGRGDAFIIMAIGTLLGGYNTMILLFIALFLCGIHAFWLLMIKKEDKKTAIPFAPFLLVSFVVYMVMK
ncbi:MAG: prepilin peptidase [Lachnospiraceae bacterium]|nr:prepilin peptidase [Lachnospiraceae bacterium]